MTISLNSIRSTFLDYFQRQGHTIVPSSPLVPRNDPTLMFTNAGMVQFKNVFTGLEKRDYDRAVTSQKCVRAGGKHNDLDNVGYTARHHTFFEMLGNFSFGDYFKEDAIAFAWELVTREFDIDAKRLLVTVYHEDEQAFDIWKKLTGWSDDRIIRIATSDNFWAMGDTGPCGPCSEIFFDHGDHIWGGPPGSPDEDGDRFIEIWNLVFMQFEQRGPGDRVDLPKPSIDTGMGLERISALLQGTHDNYGTDLFKALIAASVELTGVDADAAHQASHRVIADHLRSSCFLITDGVLPSNEGRGYVLRRIMRRAMRHAHLLGARDPLMFRLVPALVREMGQSYPELVRAESLLSETLRLEEERFRRTLSRGLGLLDEATDTLGDGAVLDGEVAFKLYDTYGFPLDLTQDALKSRGITVDTDRFNAAMERQRAEARAAWAGSGESADDTVWLELRDEHGATEFLGYEALQAEGQVLALVRDGKPVKQVRKGDVCGVVVNQTPFYAEAGGQVGDTGVIRGPKGVTLTVRDTQKFADGLYVHTCECSKGPLRPGDDVELTVDAARRRPIQANHSATHIIHEALRLVLGDHIAQKGSRVAPDRLRFDFSHPKAISTEELESVERLANAIALTDAGVETRVMDVDSAIESGARALFGEKYGDEVRVVSMGPPRGHIDREAHDVLHGPSAMASAGDGAQGLAFSVELCGGTHVKRTGEIGQIKIVGESAVSAGVRRIEGLTGEAARRFAGEQDQIVRTVASLLKTPASDIIPRLGTLIEERRALEREVAQLRRAQALSGGAASAGEDDSAGRQDINGVVLLARVLDGVPAKDLKAIVDDGKAQIGSGIVAMVARPEDGKAGVVVGVTDDLCDRFNAVDLVRIAASSLGGKGGGGRPDMAQAGGPNADAADEALEAIAQAVKEQTSLAAAQ